MSKISHGPAVIPEVQPKEPLRSRLTDGAWPSTPTAEVLLSWMEHEHHVMQGPLERARQRFADAETEWNELRERDMALTTLIQRLREESP